MEPSLNTDSLGTNPGAPGAQNGWRRVETADDGIGPGRGEALPGTVSRLPRPRILTQRRGGPKGVPPNLHRKEIGRQSFPENANPDAYAGFGQPMSQGVGQYFYAPNEGNLTKNFIGALVLGNVGRGGGGPAMVSEVDRSGQWSDDDLAVLLGPDGYLPFPGDSNFEQMPGKWRFKRKDKDVSMLPQKNQTSSPEPPSQFDVGNESLIYPLAGSIRAAGKDAEVNGLKYRFGNPEPVGSYDPGDSQALIQVPVTDFEKSGEPAAEPIFDVRFWMSENPKAPGKAILDTNLAVEVYEYPAGNDPFPKKGPIDLADNKQAVGLVRQIPVQVLTEAAKKMGLEYQGAESKAEERREAVKDLSKKMDELFPEDKVKEIASTTEGMKRGDREDYLRSLGRDLVKQAGTLLPGATAEDVAKFLREAIAKFKVETPEGEFEAPDFRSVPAKDLGKYMFKDHRAAYEALPESEQNQVRKLAAETLGDSSEAGHTEEQIKEALGEIVDAATVKSAPTKKGGEPAESRKLPKDMLPQERLFRDVEGWQDDYQIYSGNSIKPDVRRVLEKQPEGEGNYFKWEYGAPSEGQDATLVIIRKPAWKDFQSAD